MRVWYSGIILGFQPKDFSSILNTRSIHKKSEIKAIKDLTLLWVFCIIASERVRKGFLFIL